MSKVTMTANEVAKELGVALNYLYNLVRTGRLEAQKQDGEWGGLSSGRARAPRKAGNQL